MKDQEPVDFSPLDPSNDAARWVKLVDSVVARGIRALRPSSVPLQLVAWLRPALAFAALAAAIVWGGAIVSGRPRAPMSHEEPAWTMVLWTTEDGLPPAWQIFGEPGEIDEAR